MASAEDLVHSMKAFESNSISDEAERAQVREAAKSLISRIETPFETIWDHVWSYPALVSAMKVCCDLELFQKWTELGGGEKSLHELSCMLNLSNTDVLVRLLRHLAAEHVIDQIDEETYRMTHFSEALGRPRMRDMWSFTYQTVVPGFMNLPSFLKDNSYTLPEDAFNTNWTHMLGRKERFFDTMSKPEISPIFQSGMAVMSMNKPAVTTIYPVMELYRSWKKDRPFVVDVGGGSGHDLEHFIKALPEMPDGSLVLQDLPGVVELANPQAPIQKMGHDFFTSQPVKGARIYHMHLICHDWPDSQARTILTNLIPAMKRGYSKILMLETVVEKASPKPAVTAHDLTMMMIASAKERTEEDWQSLIASSGLKIVKIWKGFRTEGVIEIELP